MDETVARVISMSTTMTKLISNKWDVNGSGKGKRTIFDFKCVIRYQQMVFINLSDSHSTHISISLFTPRPLQRRFHPHHRPPHSPISSPLKQTKANEQQQRAPEVSRRVQSHLFCAPLFARKSESSYKAALSELATDRLFSLKPPITLGNKATWLCCGRQNEGAWGTGETKVEEKECCFCVWRRK